MLLQKKREREREQKREKKGRQYHDRRNLHSVQSDGGLFKIIIQHLTHFPTQEEAKAYAVKFISSIEHYHECPRSIPSCWHTERSRGPVPSSPASVKMKIPTPFVNITTEKMKLQRIEYERSLHYWAVGESQGTKDKG